MDKTTTILICEDDRLISQIARQVLENEHTEVVVVDNGAKAINELKKRTFDLVITDAIMPERNGLEVSSFIRRHQRSQTPILMMSGVSEAQYIKVAKEKGVNDFLSKPFSAERLQRKVQQLLSRNLFVSSNLVV